MIAGEPNEAAARPTYLPSWWVVLCAWLLLMLLLFTMMMVALQQLATNGLEIQLSEKDSIDAKGNKKTELSF